MGIVMSMYYAYTSILKKRKFHKAGKRLRLRLRGTIINGKLIEVGDNFEVSENYVFAVYPEFGGNRTIDKIDEVHGIHIGNNVSMNRNVKFYCAEYISVGDGCMFGSDILISDNNHGMNPTKGLYREQPLVSKPVIIGSNCWIAERVSILSGVEIGNNCVIGCGSVVTKNIPDNCIAIGNPARIVKRFNFELNQWERV